MEYPEIANTIISIKDKDLKLRNQLLKDGKLNNGYQEEMENLHKENAEILDKIITEIGYPTIEKVGKEASEATWLIIQHAISLPHFMKKCKVLLQNLEKNHVTYSIHLAYLSDRISVLEGKPQEYGTQFDWDKNGEMMPNFYEDIEQVNKRRKTIGLNTLEEQISIIQKQVKQENQYPPKNFEERKNEIENWKKNNRLDRIAFQIYIQFRIFEKIFQESCLKHFA